MPTLKTKVPYASRWLCALTAGVVASGCLSINDRFQERRPQQSTEQTTQTPVTQAPSTPEPANTTVPPHSASTTQPITAETDATRGPVDTTDQSTTIGTTSLTSITSTSSSSSTTLASSSSSTSSSSDSSNSSTTSSTTSSDTSTGSQEPQDCQQPTICYEHNSSSSRNLTSFVDFQAYATRFPKEAGTFNVKRVEFITGALAGIHSIHIKEEDGSDPGQTLRQSSFSVFVSSGWRGANFTPPVRISSENPRWIAWFPTLGSIASMASNGVSIPSRRMPTFSTQWFSTGDPIMIRVYCCP